MSQDVKALVQALLEVMSGSDLRELEFARDGFTVRLSRGGAGPGPVAAPAAPASAAASAAPAPVAQAAIAPTGAATQSIDSPLFGTVHLSPAPGQPPFARVGDRVSAGQTLCTVEAMKMFHEVAAEADGTLLSVQVSGGQEVTAGQPLFSIG